MSIFKKRNFFSLNVACFWSLESNWTLKEEKTFPPLDKALKWTYWRHLFANKLLLNKSLTLSWTQRPNILKVGSAGWKNPQISWNFLHRDCLATHKLSSLHCQESLHCSFSLIMFRYWLNLWEKIYQHSVCMFSLKIPFRKNIIVILIIYVLFGRQFWHQD